MNLGQVLRAIRRALQGDEGLPLLRHGPSEPPLRNVSESDGRSAFQKAMAGVVPAGDNIGQPHSSR